MRLWGVNRKNQSPNYGASLWRLGSKARRNSAAYSCFRDRRTFARSSKDLRELFARLARDLLKTFTRYALVQHKLFIAPRIPLNRPAGNSRRPGAAGAAASAPSKYLLGKLNIKSLFLDPARIPMGLWIMDYEIMRL